MGGEGWCHRIRGLFLGVPSQNSSGLGYRHTVERLIATSCCGSLSTSERKPGTVIPTHKDRETEAQQQLMNRSWSFRRQMITTTVPTAAQPPLASKLLLWNKIASAMPWMEPDSPLDSDILRRLFCWFFFCLALAPACVAGPTRWHCVTAALGLCHSPPREKFGVQALHGGGLG